MELLFLIFAILIVFGAIFFIFLETYIILGGHFRGAPFVRSSQKRIKTMLELAQIQPDEIVFDLGSGDGTLVIAAAQNGAKDVVGVEINPFLVWYSRWRVKRAGLESKAKILRRDFRSFPLGEADVIFAYLLPATMKNLKEKFLRELKPGAKVVSHAFPISDWPPLEEKNSVFLYLVPN